MSLLYGVAVLILVWWLAKLFAGANPKVLAKLGKTAGGVASLGVAALLMARGRMDMAVFLGGIGAWLLGWSATGPGGIRFPWADRGGPTPGATSKVGSILLEMELDHDSGAMRGKVRSGAYAGRDLDSLEPAELSALMRDCLARDPDGARLLEAYLDRRSPGWREDAQGDRDPGQRGAPGAGAMTQQEAYEILGLQAGAGEEAIREAHRALMKRIHPDAGGTSGLAARVNQAKDVLLKRG
ncbi:MAG: molecular chaperone DnaJ [Bosea sp.]|uniref:DnaJ domain-containing protein n=1 Tax=unclassified Bosea (in: a-proteobacteria) TaxID=2653178 RepID=UPI0009698476|nr:MULTISPECIES: DnaJ domain-containing protein [unclassified Bosea (in: a-proteobacteria)]MBN9457026.1 molecular chaperone DnaJ [Bosea sp. (in: a-proteobacteria)]OJV09942.1 MAG: molecular chaperone DnaJ [Bosea sp. 67-29]